MWDFNVTQMISLKCKQISKFVCYESWNHSVSLSCVFENLHGQNVIANFQRGVPFNLCTILQKSEIFEAFVWYFFVALKQKPHRWAGRTKT